MCIFRWQTILIHVFFRHCTPVIIQDSCSWPYDKTYDTQSFVGQGNIMTLSWKCHTRAAPSYDIFKLGFVIFPRPTHYRVSSVNCLLFKKIKVTGMNRECTGMTQNPEYTNCPSSNNPNCAKKTVKTWANAIIMASTVQETGVCSCACVQTQANDWRFAVINYTAGRSSLVISMSDCSERGPRFEPHCKLSQWPVRYTALGIGCTP